MNLDQANKWLTLVATWELQPTDTGTTTPR